MRSFTWKRAVALATVAGVALAAAPALQAREAGVAAAVNSNALTLPPLEEERTLVVGHNVVFDEKITTGDRGQAQLLMLDQSAVTVAPNSQLVIDKFVYDPEKKTGEMALSLSRGLMRFVGGRLSKSGNVEVRTPAATMGIRGGIVMVQVVSPTVVDVTLLYGEAVTGTTEGGRGFTLRRHGYSTRVETGKGASPPQPATAQTIAQAVTQLQGRPDADGGALEPPTQEGTTLTLGVEPPPVEQAPPIQSPQKPHSPPTAEGPGGGPDGGGTNPFVPGDPGRPPLPDVTVPDDQNPGGDGGNQFSQVLFDLSAARQGNQSFDVNAQRIQVVGSDAVVSGTVGLPPNQNSNLDANDFEVGDRFFRVGAAGGELIAFLNSGALAFFEPGVGDQNNVRNIFDANDNRTYISPQAYNAAVGNQGGAAALGVFRAQNISSDLFFNYDLSTSDFDGVNGSRITLVGGRSLTAIPNGVSFFTPAGDSQTLSFLPYSEIGRARLPLGGGVAGVNAFAAANVKQSPVIVDWTHRKAIYVGGVFQNLRGEANTNGPMAYGIQAFVGNVGIQDGIVVINGQNAGSSHFERSANEVRRFHIGDAVASPFGAAPSGLALSLDGGHSFIEHQDANGVRQNPTFVANHQFSRQQSAQAIDGAGAGSQVETLFVAGILAEGDGDFSVIATNPTNPDVPGAGRLTVDRDAMQLSALIRVEDGDGVVDSFTTDPVNSAFFNDNLFAIAQDSDGAAGSNAPGFAIVSGEAVAPAKLDPCACEFMHWGFWAAAENEPGEVGNVLSDIGVFFAGVQTPEIDMPISGSGSYAGHAYASMITPGQTTPAFAHGAFEMTTQFATGVSAGVMTLNSEVDSQAFSLIGRHARGMSDITVEYRQNAQVVGQGHGAFYGPNAANVGVTIDIDNGAGLKAGGAAVAQRTDLGGSVASP